MSWLTLFIAVAVLGGLLHILIDMLERHQTKSN